MLLMHLTNVREDSEFYKSCIANIKCPHEKEDLDKLSEKEVKKTLMCIINRELKCIQKEIEHEK